MTATRVLRILLATVFLAAIALPCRAMGPLHQAAATGDAEFVKTWIAKKRNLDQTYDEPSHGIEGNYARANGITALGKGISEAACFSQTPLKLLAFLEKNAVRFPRNTLHCAAYNYTVRSMKSIQERIAIAAFFLDHGADPDDLAFKHFTPLMGAAAAPDLEMAKFLVKRGAKPNVQNPEGLTDCCSDKQQTAIQRRICAVFGL